MTDPVTLTAIITGLVSTFSAYLTYRAAVVKANEQDQPAPAAPADANKAEAVAAAVETAITTHGTLDDRADLANFQRNPQRYAANLATVLNDLAERNPAFAQQLQTLAQNAGVQVIGVQGNVNVSGGTVNGAVTGVNTGSISGTYTFGKDDQKPK